MPISVSEKLHNIALALFCIMPLLLAISRAGADISFCVIGILFIAHCKINKYWEWLKSPEFRVLMGLYAVMLFSSIISTNPMQSGGQALAWGRFILFYFAVVFWLLTTQRALHMVRIAVLVILVGLVIDTGWQYFTGASLSGVAPYHNGGGRLFGPMHHPNIGNLLLKISLPVAGLLSYALLEKKNIWLNLAFAIYAFSTISLIIVSGERSVALLMFLGLGVAAGLAFILIPKIRLYIIGLTVGFISLVTYLVATQNFAHQRSIMLVKQLSNFWESTYGQLYLSAFTLWKENPILGIGPANFRHQCPDIAQKIGIKYCDLHPHNIYIQWLSEAGLIGVLLFTLAMVMIGRRLLKNILFEGSGFLPAAFACGTFALLVFPLIVTQNILSNWPAMLFWYSLSLAVCVPRIAQQRMEQKNA